MSVSIIIDSIDAEIRMFSPLGENNGSELSCGVDVAPANYKCPMDKLPFFSKYRG